MPTKRKYTRKFRRYLRGSVDEELGLGTLAAKTVVGVDFDETVNERTLVSSIIGRYSLSNVTPVALTGPVLVGIAHGDYSDAEIEAWIENTGSWNEGDKVAQEIAKRKIRRVGTFPSSPTGIPADQAVLKDGEPIKTKLNWILNQGESLKLWAYNTGSIAFATTAPVVDVQGHANLWPR